MRHNSICSYVDYVGRLIRQQTGASPEAVVTASLQTRWALQAVKRLDGASKQRARPITPAEVVHACTRVRGSRGFVLAFRVIVLTAWHGALRLGQLLPHAAFPLQTTMSLRDLALGAGKVLITSRRSKTNVFQERTRTIAIPACPEEESYCLARAVSELLEYRRSLGLPTDVKLCELDIGLQNFDDLVEKLQSLIPRREASKQEKGHITGHSFRRGFTHAALAASYTLEQIMIHGDWSHPDSVLDAYASGGVLPSIALAIDGRPRSTFVTPSNKSVPQDAGRRYVSPVRSSASNPYMRSDQVGTDLDAFTADPELASRIRRARDWELDH